MIRSRVKSNVRCSARHNSTTPRLLARWAERSEATRRSEELTIGQTVKVNWETNVLAGSQDWEIKASVGGDSSFPHTISPSGSASGFSWKIGYECDGDGNPNQVKFISSEDTQVRIRVIDYSNGDVGGHLVDASDAVFTVQP